MAFNSNYDVVRRSGMVEVDDAAGLLNFLSPALNPLWVRGVEVEARVEPVPSILLASFFLAFTNL